MAVFYNLLITTHARALYAEGDVGHRCSSSAPSGGHFYIPAKWIGATGLNSPMLLLIQSLHERQEQAEKKPGKKSELECGKGGRSF